MTEPRVLDLFCGGGGCSVGYARAGFAPYGIDKHVMPHYPFMEVEQADWRAVVTDAAFVAGFDLIHASPVCKGYSSLKHLSDTEHPLEIPDVRAALEATGKPYVIENVVGARDAMRSPVLLCGSMFGLEAGGGVLRRHRLFESNVPLTAPGPCSCAGRKILGVYGTGGAWKRTAPGGGGTKVSGADAAALMGVDWTADQGVLSQMIPPAYCQHLGEQILAAITQKEAA